MPTTFALLRGIVVDYYLAATLLLGAALVLGKCIAGPSRRMVLAWTVSLGLLWLAIAAALPTSLRISLASFTSETASAETSPLAGAAALPAILQDAEQRPQAIKPAAAPPADAAAATSRASDDHEADIAASSPRWSYVPSWSATLLAGYVVGAAGVLAWLIAGGVRARAVCRTARSADAHLVGLLSTVVAGQGIVPCLLVARDLPSAAAVGLWKPKILLPEWMLGDADDVSLTALLAHEWTHIRNRDLWLMALCRALLVVLYVHPLYWWLRRSIQVDQEVLADAAASGVMSPAGYAEQLLRWSEAAAGGPRHRLAMSVGLWERPSQLSRRIRILLHCGGRVAAGCSRRWKFGLSAVVALIALGLSLLTMQPGRTVAAEPAAGQAKAEDAGAAETAPDKQVAEPGAEQGVSYVIDGRVLGPDGQPFAGAKLYAIIKSAENKEPQLRDPTQPPFQITARAGKAPLLKMVHPKLVAIFKKLGKDTTIAADDPFMRSAQLEREWGKIMPELYKTHPAMPPPVRATSDADGRFRFELAKSDITAPLEEDVSVVAVAPDFGPAWNLSHEPGALSGLELRLAEDLPIRGRIVDHRKAPISGATVRLGTLIDSPESTVDFWKSLVRAYIGDLDPRHTFRDFNRLLGLAMSYQFPGYRLTLFPREVVTDADGRFTISGLGADRVVYKMEVTAPDEGSDTFSVMTVNGFDLPIPEKSRWGAVRPEYRTYGATFEHQLRQEQIIEGTIRDATGQPVSNVQVASWSPTYVDTFTDEGGKYRLTGLSRDDTYSVTAWPWENRRSQRPYLNLTKRLDGAAADGPIVADFDLIRGVILRGTLTDQQGKPVAGVQVHYGAYPEGGWLDDTFYPDNPKFPPPKGGVIIAPFNVPAFEQAHTQTDDQGQFSLIVLPGKGVLGVFVGDQFAAAEQMEKDPELQQFSGTVPRLQGYRFNAIESLEVPRDASEIERKWTIDLKPAPTLPETE